MRFLFLIFTIGILALQGCGTPEKTGKTKYLDGEIAGSNVTATQVYDVHEFDGVLIDRSFDVRIAEGLGPRITITADDNIVPLLTPEINDGMLMIKFSKGFKTRHEIKILIEAPDVGKIHHEGTGTVLLDNLKLKFLEVVSSGPGKITGMGEADKLWIESTGKGQIMLQDLTSKKCEILLSGAGQVVVTATEEMNAVNRGKGDIVYYGRPPVKTVKNTGAGEVKEK